jgi:hypothetical protein
VGDQAGVAPGLCIVEREIEIRRRERPPCLVRPFDQNYRVIPQDFPKACIHPFARIAKSIKIKVIEV